MASDLTAEINIVAVDAASNVLRNVGQAFGKFFNKMPGPAKVVAGALGLVGGLAIGVGTKAVQMAADFQTGLTQLVTGAGESKDNMQLVSDGILNLATSTGTSTQQLLSGMYMIESAGYHGAQGLNVLQIAAEGAKVGNADLGTVSDALTTILTDYHLKATDAASAMNGLTVTVGSGKTHLINLASSMGSVLPLASSLGVSFAQVGGAMATMTNHGMSAQRAAQNLANSIRSLAAPNATAQKSMKAVGLTAQQVKDALSTQGLTGALQLIEEHVGKKFPAGSVQAVQAFKAIMGGATGYNVALMLGGKNMQEFTGDVATISGAMNKGGNTVQGWNLVQGTFNEKMADAKEAVEVLMIKIGQALLPTVTTLVAQITPLITAFGNWITKSGVLQQVAGALEAAISGVGSVFNQVASYFQSDSFAGVIADFQTLSYQLGPILTKVFQTLGPIAASVFSAIGPILTNVVIPAIDQVVFWLGQVLMAINTGDAQLSPFTATIANVAGWFNQWKGVIGVVAGLILAFFVPALIQAGVQSLIAGGKMATGFVLNMVKSGYEAVINGAKIAINFVKSVIATGIAAWQSAGKIALMVYQVIASGTQAVIAGAKIAVSFVANMIRSGAMAAWAGLQIAGKFVWSLIQAGVQAVIAGAKFVGSLIPAILSFVANAVMAAATAIPPMITGFIAWTIGAWNAAAATIAATWPILLIIAAIALLVVGIILLVQHWSQVTAFLKSAWQVCVNGIMVALHVLAGIFVTIWNGIVSLLKAVWAWILNAAKIAFIALILIIGGPILWIALLIYSHWNQILGFLKAAWAWVVDTAKSLWANVVAVFSGAWSNLQRAVQGLWQNLVHEVSSWPAMAQQWGISLITGLINGIMGMFGNIGNAMHSVANFIGSFLPHSPAKQGELSHLNEYGPNLVKGVAAGIAASTPILQTSLNALVSPVGATVATAAAGASGGAAPVSATASGGATASGAAPINIIINMAPGRTKNEAQQIAEEVLKVLSRQLNRSGNLVTWTSGGRS